MTATGPHHARSRPIGDFVSELIGTDVDAPELKAQLARMVSPTFEVISGEKSGITFLAEHSGMYERSVIDVLMALENVPLPDVVADKLTTVGFDRDDISKIDIGVKRVAQFLVMQHCGVLRLDDQRPSEPEASS